MERIYHRNCCPLTFPSRDIVCMPTTANGGRVPSLSLQGLDPKGEDWYLLMRRYSEGASMIQMKESREKPRTAREARDHCCREPLTLHTCSLLT